MSECNSDDWKENNLLFIIGFEFFFNMIFYYKPIINNIIIVYLDS